MRSMASESIRSQLSGGQQKKPVVGSAMSTGSNNFMEGAENRYDPEGEISAICRPLLKDQKVKLENILASEKKGKKGGGSGRVTKRSGETEIVKQKDANMTAKVIQQADEKVRRSLTLVMNITNTHDESPTVKAKKGLFSKNDI